VPYYHVVFTLPAAIADIAYQNKAVIYDLLFKASEPLFCCRRQPDERNLLELDPNVLERALG